VSLGGCRTNKQTTLYALAVACSYGENVKALSQVNAICRTASMLYQFVQYAELHRGWGRGLRHAVARWYLERDAASVAYQGVKYRKRLSGNWTHRDMVRLASHKFVVKGVEDPAYLQTIRWFETGVRGPEVPQMVKAYEGLIGLEGKQLAQASCDAVRLGLPWEALPDEARTFPEVWRALVVEGMPITALIRQLPTLSKHGLLAPLAKGTMVDLVTAQLTDQEAIRRGRVHPFQLFVALKTYAAGHSPLSGNSWAVSAPVVQALGVAFDRSFKEVRPSGARTLLALDVSGSMGNPLYGTASRGQRYALPVTAREGAAVMAMATLAAETNVQTVAFTGAQGEPDQWSSYVRGYQTVPAVTPLPLTRGQRLDDVVRTMTGLPFGRTDCALPMLYALYHNLEVDTFVIYTDNETWAGKIHVHQALQMYREKSGIPAKLVAVGMTATEYSVADPKDAGQMNVVGFDSSAPAVIADFSRVAPQDSPV